MMRAAGVAVVALALAGCDDGRPGPLADCGGDLRGVWHDDAGRRFDAVGGAKGWELYPMYDDRPGDLPAGVVAAPGVIDFGPPPELAGTYLRRYERGAAVCVVRTEARLRACRGDHVTLDVQPPPLPDLAACPDGGVPMTAPLESWQLVRER